MRWGDVLGRWCDAIKLQELRHHVAASLKCVDRHINYTTSTALSLDLVRRRHCECFPCDTLNCQLRNRTTIYYIDLSL